MSNFLAIATVTAVLTSRIETLLDANGLTGFNVEGDHPNGDSNPGVYLKLYRVVPNPALYPADTPTRRADGSMIQQPQLAIDLHYLLSFVGDSGTFDAERLAGLVMLDLHARPVLTANAIANYVETLEADHVLQSADLADQIELVRFTPIPMTTEEMSRVWGLLNQSFYGLTVAYQASVVLLDLEIPAITALPVGNVAVRAFAAALPRIRGIRSSAVNQPVVELGQDLILHGSGFIGESTWLQLGEEIFEVPRDSNLRSDRIVFPITAALGIPLGAITVQVVHRVNLGHGSSDAYRTAAESNTAVFALVPNVTMASPNPVSTAEGIEVNLAVVPTPAAEQTVELLLDEVGGDHRHRTSTRWRVDGDRIIFALEPLPAGQWLVRLRVDGVVSLLRRDSATGRYNDPMLTVP